MTCQLFRAMLTVDCTTLTRASLFAHAEHAGKCPPCKALFDAEFEAAEAKIKADHGPAKLRAVRLESEAWGAAMVAGMIDDPETQPEAHP